MVIEPAHLTGAAPFFGYFRPACFSIALSVPFGISFLETGTVTLPEFVFKVAMTRSLAFDFVPAVAFKEFHYLFGSHVFLLSMIIVYTKSEYCQLFFK